MADAYQQSIDLGEAGAEAGIKKRLKTLGDLILTKKILDALEKKRLWLISPDSALWMVPWQALPDSKGEYAVMNHDVRLLTSGRDLTRPADAPARGRAVLLGDPDFDSGRGTMLARATGRVYEKDARSRGVPLRASDLASLYWGRVPGTGKEVRKIRPFVSKITGESMRSYTRGRATEAVFKALDRPRFLVISSHGFYLPPPDPRAGDALAVPLHETALRLLVPPGARVWIDGAETRERVVRSRLPAGKRSVRVKVRIELRSGEKHERRYQLEGGKAESVLFGLKEAPRTATLLENPLIRCGVVLSGANNRHLLPLDADDDGILTGLEIVGTDLRGTELVVLSACETGAGDIRSAEGIAGLRQAFQLAGARRVVASLWKVPDDETASLMARFWARLAQGIDSAEALCDGQRTFVLSRRRNKKASHPHYWAAFTVTGR